MTHEERAAGFMVDAYVTPGTFQDHLLAAIRAAAAQARREAFEEMAVIVERACQAYVSLDDAKELAAALRARAKEA